MGVWEKLWRLMGKKENFVTGKEMMGFYLCAEEKKLKWLYCTANSRCLRSKEQGVGTLYSECYDLI